MKKIIIVLFSLAILTTPLQIVQAKGLTPVMYAAGLVNHKMSQSEMSMLLSKSMKFQWQVARQVFILQGNSIVEADTLVKEWQLEIKQSQSSITLAAVGSCEQPVEHRSVVRDASYAYMVTSFPSSRGTEYLYYFYPWWNVDPSNIRWGASDPLVQWAIWIRTSGNGVAGHNLCSKPFTLQLGNTTVSAAGGQYWVMANLYVHHL